MIPRPLFSASCGRLNARAFLSRDTGPIRQLRDGLLNKLRNQHLLQQAFAKTPTKEGAAEVGKGGKKAGAQGQVAGSY